MDGYTNATESSRGAASQLEKKAPGFLEEMASYVQDMRNRMQAQTSAIYAVRMEVFASTDAPTAVPDDPERANNDTEALRWELDRLAESITKQEIAFSVFHAL